MVSSVIAGVTQDITPLLTCVGHHGDVTNDDVLLNDTGCERNLFGTSAPEINNRIPMIVI